MIFKTKKINIGYLAVIISTALIYFALCTHLTYKFDSSKGYYGLQAEAFMNGKLSLMIKPNPKLLKLEDPYDPKQNSNYRLHDASLFHDKYYLYWGPTPAIIRMLTLNKLPEQLFTYLYVLGSSIILLKILTYYSKKIMHYLDKRLSIYLIFFMATFNGIVISLLSSKGIYYESIATAQFFFLLAIYHILLYSSTQKIKYLFLTNVFLSLSFTSRFLYILPTTIIVFYQLHTLFKTQDNNLKKMFIVLSPITLSLFLTGFYNFKRFENIFEFGNNYQLLETSIKLKPLVNIHNIPNNLKNYFLAFPNFSTTYPFFTINPNFYSRIGKLVFSIFLISPICLFSFYKHKFLKKNKFIQLLQLSFISIVFGISFLIPDSATKYMFDFIFILNILASINILTLTPKSISKLINLFLLLAFLFLQLPINYAMWLQALAEYNHEQYINQNVRIYQLTNNYKYIDKNILNKSFIQNKTNFNISNIISTKNSIEHDPSNDNTWIWLNEDKTIINLISFEKEQTSITLKAKLAPGPSHQNKQRRLKISTEISYKEFFFDAPISIEFFVNLQPGCNYVYLDTIYPKENFITLKNDPLRTNLIYFTKVSVN